MTIPGIQDHRHELLVVAGLLLILLSVELTLRIFENRLSRNIAHINSIPVIAQEMDSLPLNRNILFLGNSLTNNAINKESFISAVNNSSNKPSSAYKVTPDGTTLSDWYCIYQNQFANLSQPPSHIVIGFAWAQLSDKTPIVPTRLGGFFCSVKDIDAFSKIGQMVHQQLFRFVAGMASRVYVNREAIRNRVLRTVIPDYTENTQKLNQHDRARNNKISDDQFKHSYKLLEGLVKSIQQSNTQITIMAMPVLNTYGIDKQLITLTERLDVNFLDLRKFRNLDHHLFKDPIHLNQVGSQYFSHYLAEQIRSSW